MIGQWGPGSGGRAVGGRGTSWPDRTLDWVGLVHLVRFDKL